MTLAVALHKLNATLFALCATRSLYEGKVSRSCYMCALWDRSNSMDIIHTRETRLKCAPGRSIASNCAVQCRETDSLIEPTSKQSAQGRTRADRSLVFALDFVNTAAAIITLIDRSCSSPADAGRRQSRGNAQRQLVAASLTADWTNIASNAVSRTDIVGSVCNSTLRLATRCRANCIRDRKLSWARRHRSTRATYSRRRG